jgi:hypothetical protein
MMRACSRGTAVAESGRTELKQNEQRPFYRMCIQFVKLNLVIIRIAA